MEKLLKFMSLVVVMILVTAASFYFAYKYYNKENYEQISVDVYAAVVNENVYRCAEQTYDIFVNYEDVEENHYFWYLISIEKSDAFWRFSSRKVVAEVDFSQLNRSDINVNPDTVFVSLPEPEIRICDESEDGNTSVTLWFTETDEVDEAEADSILNSIVNRELEQIVLISGNNLRVIGRESTASYLHQILTQCGITAPVVVQFHETGLSQSSVQRE